MGDTVLLTVVFGGALGLIGYAGVLGLGDMTETDEKDTSGRMRRLAPYVIACLAILALTAFLSYELYVAAGSSVAQKDFTGFAALFGLIAVVAGAFAVVFAFPTFGTWLLSVFRTPDMKLEITLSPDRFTVPRPTVSTVTNGIFFVQARAFNEGKGALKGAVANICVPAGCEIEVLDDQRKNHCAAALPQPLTDFVQPVADDDPADVAFSTAWDDMEAQTHYVFNVKVKVPEPGAYRVIFLVNGNPEIPPDRAICRVNVHVASVA